MATNKSEVAVLDTNLPAYMQDYKGPTGTEDIDIEDITIPRIKLAQGLSPEVTAGTVKLGSLFLNVTGEVLAEPGEDLAMICVARSKEFILWQDRQFDGGGILARAHKVTVNGETRYEWDKQGQTFENKIKGILPVTWKTLRYVDENKMDKFGSANINDPDSHPAATAHHNFVVVLPNHDNLVAAISLSNSQVKRAKDWNFMLNSGGQPIFIKEFLCKSVEEVNKAGDEFRNLDFKPNGFIEKDVKLFTEKMFLQFIGTGFSVDQSDVGADAASGDSGKF